MALVSTPNGINPINTTTDPIRNNFIFINNAFELNHYPYGTPHAGKHIKIDFPLKQTTPTTPSTAAGAMALYTSTGTVSTQTEMTLRRESNGTVVQFTESSQATSGFTRTPSGVTIQWGDSTTDGAGGTKTVTFPTAFSSAVYQIILTAKTSDATRVIINIDTNVAASTTQFGAVASVLTGATPTMTAVNRAFSWIAIGV